MTEKKRRVFVLFSDDKRQYQKLARHRAKTNELNGTDVFGGSLGFARLFRAGFLLEMPDMKAFDTMAEANAGVFLVNIFNRLVVDTLTGSMVY